MLTWGFTLPREGERNVHLAQEKAHKKEEDSCCLSEAGFVDLFVWVGIAGCLIYSAKVNASISTLSRLSCFLCHWSPYGFHVWHSISLIMF